MTTAPTITVSGQDLRRNLAVAMLVGEVVTWRIASYYAGGIDPVVAAKGVIGLAAAVLAYSAACHAPQRQRLNVRVVMYVALYCVVTLFGAVYTSTTFTSSLVLVARLALITFTVYQLALAFPILALVRTVALWMGVIAFVASVTGSTAGSLLVGANRLIGGIPPLLPNEIAELCSLILIVILWRDLEGRGRIWDAPLVVGLLALILLSGSRTTLGFLVVALVLLLAQAKLFNIGVAVMALLIVPLAAYVVLGTTLVQGFFSRGGAQNVDTLSQRTVAWSAALHVHTQFWDTWFGNGLSRVKVPVVAQFRTEQILDSSWFSALVQSGYIGVVVLAIWLLDTLVSVCLAGRPFRPLALTLFVYLLMRGTLESGLIGATPAFVFFVLIGLAATRCADHPGFSAASSRFAPSRLAPYRRGERATDLAVSAQMSGSGRKTWLNQGVNLD